MQVRSNHRQAWASYRLFGQTLLALNSLYVYSRLRIVSE